MPWIFKSENFYLAHPVFYCVAMRHDSDVWARRKLDVDVGKKTDKFTQYVIVIECSSLRVSTVLRNVGIVVFSWRLACILLATKLNPEAWSSRAVTCRTNWSHFCAWMIHLHVHWMIHWLIHGWNLNIDLPQEMKIVRIKTWRTRSVNYLCFMSVH